MEPTPIEEDENVEPKELNCNGNCLMDDGKSQSSVNESIGATDSDETATTEVF